MATELLKAREALCWAVSTLLPAPLFPPWPLAIPALALLPSLADEVADVAGVAAAGFALLSGEGVAELLTLGRAPAEEGTGVAGLLPLLRLVTAAAAAGGVGKAAAASCTGV
jgi:hypothetical protein